MMHSPMVRCGELLRRGRGVHLYATCVLAVLAAFALSACHDADRTEGARGGTAVMSGYYALRNMNPLATTADVNLAIERYALFTPLIRYDSAMREEPWLASSWDTVRVGADSLDLTFHLRTDVKWQDGRTVTANDVAFTYDLARDSMTAYANSAAFALYSPHYDVIDSATIRFRLRAHPDFLEAWFITPPLPAHVLRGVRPQDVASSDFGMHPVGSGPFRFLSHEGGTWTFEGNRDFPQGLGGPPRLDRLVYRTIPEQTSVITALLSGDIDLAVSIRPSNLPAIRAAHDVHILQFPTPNWIFVAFNTRTPYFDTAIERRAIALGTDRKSIINVIMGGANPVGRATVTPVHRDFAAGDASLVIPYDPDSAKVLLAKAGWRDRDGDGVVEDASGRPFRFRIKAWQSSGAYADIVQMMQAQLRTIGVDVKADVTELNTFVQQMQGTVGADGRRTRDFDAALANWTDNIRKDDSQLFHSRFANGPRGWTGYSSPRMDALIDSLAVTTDAASAQRLWLEYQHMIVDDLPVFVLYYAVGLNAVQNRLRGPATDARGPLATVQNWWIAR